MRRALAAVLLALLPLSAWAGETRPFIAGSWQALRQAHVGRPLVVHLWSLTCAPCLAELPRWQALAGQGGGADLVLVSTDPVEQAPRLTATLARAGLGGVESWAFADSFVERLRFEIDRRWRGELPRTVLIAADGTVTSVSGMMEADELAAWLKRETPHAARP
ncbi:MAG TPA: TlpA family protein disulfide reductase [Magnetospirillum sp.]|jgi:thiol-disulfide isomerase/thioredoxin|nr:TlpA family protein disulfide reductase [Magnetospirillum sp.]